MKRFLVAMTFWCAAGAPALAAQTEQEAVMAVVNRLFDGMRAGDSAMVRSVFHENARLMRAGARGLSDSDVGGFVTMIGTPREEIYNEPIWDAEVRIDGSLAQVWTKYAFFRGPNGDQFSHCGVDAFLLHRGTDGWKIFVLSDTSQREGCEMPPGR